MVHHQAPEGRHRRSPRQLFTKLARELTVAARQGDPNPDMNVRLRLAVQKARENNMPLDNIERAIKRGTEEATEAAMPSLRRLTRATDRAVWQLCFTL